MNPIPCSVCQQDSHHARKCPELVKDLETGFYKPAGGMPQGGDKDDESLRANIFQHAFHQIIRSHKWISIVSQDLPTKKKANV